ncbi:TPA: hypothetical protein L3M97_001791 [Vibrio parahaemolyticus]|nr:hypothetical protein [Vibrio parahaemolyticus]
MKLKNFFLASLIAVSAPTFASDTAEYRINLDFLNPEELSVELVDQSGAPIPGVQNVTMTPQIGESIEYLVADGLFSNNKLKTNNPSQAFKLTRTLSPLNLDDKSVEVDPLNTYKKSFLNVDTTCDEQHEQWGFSVSDNTVISVTSTMPGGLSEICSADVAYEFESLKSGQYSSTLTLDISPSL